jgi:hypothetical protein
VAGTSLKEGLMPVDYDEYYLLPSALEAMRLGLVWDHERFLVTEADEALMAEAPQEAWGRIEMCPRIQGHNDTVGDCAVVAAFNYVQAAMAELGDYRSLGNDEPLRVYSAVTGYVAGDPATDKGTNPIDLFNWWKVNDIGGYRLSSYTMIAAKDEQTIRRTIEVTGGAFVCFNMTQAQYNQRLFQPVVGSTLVGGHAVFADEFDGAVTWLTSWGAPYAMDRSFFNSAQMLGVFGLTLARIH